MNKINSLHPDTQARRTFVKKLSGILAALILLPGMNRIFASTQKWTNITSSGEKNKTLSGNDAILGEICIVGFNFPPKGWASCDGLLLPLSQNTALFSLLGTYYGGNGSTTFALPDLRERFPMGYGQGPGLTNRNIGDRGGNNFEILDISQIPSHTHTIRCNNGSGTSSNPANNYYARDPLGTAHYAAATGNQTLDLQGINDGHNNLHPFIVCYFTIALQGMYPARY